jgi:diguanylate cyclase (GGDEF)-like protein
MGDHVLKTVSSRLLHLIRGSDTAARLGGDEFIIVLDQPNNLDNIATIATRIIDEINLPIAWNTNTTKVGASIGIALYDHEQIDAEQLIKHADAAMYLAKKSGKNRFHFHATNAISDRSI